ncbi:MAG TPA: PQQ-binding-like beta-propeller repeat protein [Planctomycetota bacterium]|nr:PQQ-binding-like beta-propeller repeat protein [Planctomycetota bacterium]
MSVAFDPSGHRLFAGSILGEVFACDVARARRLWSHVVTPTTVIRSIATSPTEDVVVYGTQAGRVSMVNAADGTLRWSVELGQTIEQLIFHPTGARIALACVDGTVRFVSSKGELLDEALLAFDGAATTLAYLPDGSRLFVGYSTGVVRLWSDGDDELFAVRLLSQAVRRIAVSPSGRDVAIVGDHNAMHVWSTRLAGGATPKKTAAEHR